MSVGSNDAISGKKKKGVLALPPLTPPPLDPELLVRCFCVPPLPPLAPAPPDLGHPAGCAAKKRMTPPSAWKINCQKIPQAMGWHPAMCGGGGISKRAHPCARHSGRVSASRSVPCEGRKISPSRQGQAPGTTTARPTTQPGPWPTVNAHRRLKTPKRHQQEVARKDIH